jgi:hypothetical protein
MRVLVGVVTRNYVVGHFIIMPTLSNYRGAATSNGRNVATRHNWPSGRINYVLGSIYAFSFVSRAV